MWSAARTADERNEAPRHDENRTVAGAGGRTAPPDPLCPSHRTEHCRCPRRTGRGRRLSRRSGRLPLSATRHGGRVAGLYTRRFGPWPPSDTVIVMVHGLGLSGRYFTPLARSLAAEGRTVLVPDLPGNVRSRRAARRAP